MNQVVVKTFNNQPEADLAQNLLHEHNIWSMVRLGDTSAYGSGGSDITLLVKEQDLEHAKEILL